MKGMATVQKFSFTVMVAMLLGCASNEMRTISGSGSVALDPKAIVYIAIPAENSSNSPGQYVATVLADEFSKRGIKVNMAEGAASHEANLAAAQKQGAGYLIIPVLTNWEHNATQWSGNPSTLGLRLSILNAATGVQIRLDNIESQSSHLSLFGTDPKELLDDAFEKYIKDLYH